TVGTIATIDPWAVEGFHVHGSVDGGIVRVANCTFEPPPRPDVPSISVGPGAGSVVEVVNCVVPGVARFNLRPPQRSRAPNTAFAAIHVEPLGQPEPAVLELSRCLGWLPDTITPDITAGVSVDGQVVAIEANGCVFESRMLLYRANEQTALRWAGDR